MLENINKISIIGGSGTGKTTLSENLGPVMNLPVYHIDAFHHFENWVIRDQEERDKMILDTVAKEKWIIDGTYRNTLKQRIENSDLVIYLDYSSIEATTGAIMRTLKNNGKEKPEIPGCKEKMSFEFLCWVWNWRKKRRKFIMNELEENPPKQLLVFKNRRSLKKWFKKEFGKKMEPLDWNKKCV